MLMLEVTLSLLSLCVFPGSSGRICCGVILLAILSSVALLNFLGGPNSCRLRRLPICVELVLCGSGGGLDGLLSERFICFLIVPRSSSFVACLAVLLGSER